MVKSLIRGGVDANPTMFNKDTVLHLAIANYDESACLDLVNVFIEAGFDLATLNSTGETALQVAVPRSYTSVAKCLLLRNVPLPPDILVFAVQKGSTPQMVRFLVHKGADVHSTMPNGDTLLHLAVARPRSSQAHQRRVLEIVQILVDAGCSPMELDFRAETAFEAAMKCGHILVMQYLLSRDIPLPPAIDIVSKALELHCTPEIIQLLAHKYARDLATMAGLHWSSLLLLAHASYTGPERQRVLETLNVARQTNMTQPQRDTHRC